MAIIIRVIILYLAIIIKEEKVICKMIYNYQMRNEVAVGMSGLMSIVDEDLVFRPITPEKREA